MKKGLQENKTTPNVYAPNSRASKYMRQRPIELQGEIGKSTIESCNASVSN